MDKNICGYCRYICLISFIGDQPDNRDRSIASRASRRHVRVGLPQRSKSRTAPLRAALPGTVASNNGENRHWMTRRGSMPKIGRRRALV
ncbi:hypothetical protein [Paraburkholderia sp.]|uniref:hypothetical protein n=1 Tax=Paraburkholderia sp. TaxID=1926495 RepID=UPI00238E4D19|nr:hypothetical protein [Paraburkholderia sp.]MDE1181536.1 hypothetical protein [Paraburkholderia sp.]